MRSRHVEFDTALGKLRERSVLIKRRREMAVVEAESSQPVSRGEVANVRVDGLDRNLGEIGRHSEREVTVVD